MMNPSETLSLDVAVVTHGKKGLENIEELLLPPRENVRYVISWQDHDNYPVPSLLKNRNDIAIYRLEKRGLSNNRNNAMAHCSGDIILLADNDLKYYENAFEDIISAFESDPNLDMGLFKVDFPDKKIYPSEDVSLSLPLPKGYYVSSVEIALRKKSLHGLQFCPELGLGAPEMQCGEEEIFLFEALKKGLRCKFINKTICSHPFPTTGTKVGRGVLMGQGYVVASYYPLSWIFRIPLKALRISRNKNKINYFKALAYLFKGALRSKNKGTLC